MNSRKTFSSKPINSIPLRNIGSPHSKTKSTLHNSPADLDSKSVSPQSKSNACTRTISEINSKIVPVKVRRHTCDQAIISTCGNEELKENTSECDVERRLKTAKHFWSWVHFQRINRISLGKRIVSMHARIRTKMLKIVFNWWSKVRFTGDIRIWWTTCRALQDVLVKKRVYLLQLFLNIWRQWKSHRRGAGEQKDAKTVREHPGGFNKCPETKKRTNTSNCRRRHRWSTSRWMTKRFSGSGTGRRLLFGAYAYGPQHHQTLKITKSWVESYRSPSRHCTPSNSRICSGSEQNGSCHCECRTPLPPLCCCCCVQPVEVMQRRISFSGARGHCAPQAVSPGHALLRSDLHPSSGARRGLNFFDGQLESWPVSGPHGVCNSPRAAQGHECRMAASSRCFLRDFPAREDDLWSPQGPGRASRYGACACGQQHCFYLACAQGGFEIDSRASCGDLAEQDTKDPVAHVLRMTATLRDTAALLRREEAMARCLRDWVALVLANRRRRCQRAAAGLRRQRIDLRTAMAAWVLRSAGRRALSASGWRAARIVRRGMLRAAWASWVWEAPPPPPVLAEAGGSVVLSFAVA